VKRRPVFPLCFPEFERRVEADLASEGDRRRLDADLDFPCDFDLGIKTTLFLLEDPDDSERFLLEAERLFEGDRFFLEALPFRDADRCLPFADRLLEPVRRLRDLDGERRLPVDRLFLERDLVFAHDFFFD